MNLYDLSEACPAERELAELVTGFFADLAKGRFDRARARVAPRFSWFGTPVSDAAWHGTALKDFVAALPLSTGAVRPFPLALAQAVPEVLRTQVFGPLERDHQLAFVDVTRGACTVTSIVVAQAGKLLRLVDPDAFVQFVEAARSVARPLPS